MDKVKNNTVMTPEVILAAVTAGLAAFTGLSKSLSEFNKKIDERFIKVEKDYDRLETTIMRDYVLKQDFLREMQAVHQKLDRIWDHMINHKI
jgi:hypothetical protein